MRGCVGEAERGDTTCGGADFIELALARGASDSKTLPEEIGAPKGASITTTSSSMASALGEPGLFIESGTGVFIASC